MTAFLKKLIHLLTDRTIPDAAIESEKTQKRKMPAADMEVHLMGGHLIARKRETPHDAEKEESLH